MCGITGIINLQNKLDSSVLKSDLYKMTDAIKHRGKDGKGYFVDGKTKCFLGHRRLSIIDLSDTGAQPMYSYDNRYVIVFNGEIYNYKELAIELEKTGVNFTSKSDSEVLLYSYIVWGKDCLNKLRGMFAFAIWDKNEEKLFAARDHLGIKPFYWFFQENVFAFSSELKSFFNVSFFKKELNQDAISQYLSFYSLNPPDTFVKNVYMLLPAHFIELKKGELNINQYWNLNDVKTNNDFTDLESIKKNVREKLLESVKLRMRADVDVGAFLSGGLDSSTIVALMSSMTDKKIKTFSIGFGQEGQYLNELPLAKKIAQKFGCAHSELVIDGKFFKDNFNNFIDAIDQPSGDGVNSYLVASATSQHVKVALSGLGGDEVFLGYKYFYDLVKFDSASKNNFKRQFLPILSYLFNNFRLFQSVAYRSGLEFLRFYGLKDEDIYIKSRTLFSENEKIKILKLDIGNVTQAKNFLDKIFVNNIDRLNNFSKADLSWYVPGMLLRDADATSMSHTLEVRFPFLDKDLISLLLTIPSKNKIYLNQKVNKPLLANLFDDLLPEEILKYPKHGFEMPVGFWLLKYFEKEINDLKNVSWLNKTYVEKLIYDLKIRPKNYLKIWTILVLNSWLVRNQFEVFDG
jgi:asparagine synthase (glutamine-hydrolysing)